MARMLAVIWLLMFLVGGSVSSRISLDPSNKLQDMLVYINDDILEGDGSFLNILKTHINQASLSLWKATNNLREGRTGVQFGTVFIRIPKTWNATADPITWQQCNKADFYVASNRDHSSSDPFTKQLGRCGEPADFTRFSERFFVSKSDEYLKEAGKIIMTEFVKLRYGVFSEKPYNNILTVFDGYKFVNSTCGADIQWTMNKPAPVCSDKDGECKYTIIPNQNYNYSVMFDAKSPKSEFFCDDHNRPHNKWAQSLQNKKCLRRSVSSVILQHADFRENKTARSFQNVTFTVIKGQARKIALVLDVSGSMSTIIENMKLACKDFVRDFVEDSAIVGLATFDNYGEIKMRGSVMDQKNRTAMIDVISNLRAKDYTNIGDGLAKGIEILGGNIGNDEKVFGTIILLSDGQNNRYLPYQYHYAINQVIKKGIIVNTISYGTVADPGLNKLATESGGKFLFADPQTPYLKLVSQFAAQPFCDPSVHMVKLVEDTIVMEVKGSISHRNLTYVDIYLGIDVQVAVTFVVDVSRYAITLVLPSGREVNVSSSVKQPTGTTFLFNIPGKAETGMYKIQTRSPTSLRFRRSTDNTSLSLSFRVSATPDLTSPRLINPTGALSNNEISTLSDNSNITVTVDLSTSSITKEENVTVVLTMTQPSKRQKWWEMMDDGLGDDNIAGDQVFTKTIIAKDMTEKGFYTFLAKVDILNTKTAEVIRRSVDLGSLVVKQIPKLPIVDKIPPAKIENVIVDILDSKGKVLKVEILTTGNDGLVGNISDYEVKVIDFIGEKVFQVLATLPPRVKTSFTLDLSKQNVTNPFAVQVRGIDDSKNQGEWSESVLSNWNYDAIVKEYTSRKSSNPLESCFNLVLASITIIGSLTLT